MESGDGEQTLNHETSGEAPRSHPLALRVFISSPGDVSDERGIARDVLHYLPREAQFKERLVFQEIAWDSPGGATPLAAHLTPQQAINQNLPTPSQCDVVIVILWSRMGTPLPR